MGRDLMWLISRLPSIQDVKLPLYPALLPPSDADETRRYIINNGCYHLRDLLPSPWRLQSVGSYQGDEVMPAKFEDDLILVAAGPPLSDSSFLSSKIMDLCGDLPIFWLRPTHSPDGDAVMCAGGQRKSRAAPRERRQAAAAVEDEDGGPQFNPENPYQRGLEGEQGAADIDPILDHQGVCCSECRRGYTHCQRICEPLGHQSWPYHYRGCRVACRVIMPCKWWVARIMGLV
ncbi:hypothetical protein CCH79_00011367 [Gambusia affinis]|uniref:Uncharacterized protein n=1 Tax=Gambusia affinis TaxID=33528 RepID=A0A315V1J9_GAMAF|nr:hypothetical protein CCH79_00011367 [Gambusia affinis]